MVKKTVLYEWRDKHPSVQKWLSRMAKSTRYNYLRYAYQFFEWLKNTEKKYSDIEPEELLTLQDHTHGRERFEQLDLLQTWINEQKVRIATKRQMYSAVRSYYAYGRVPLPQDRMFILRSEKTPINSEMTREDLQKIILSSNDTYQAVYLVMFQSAMGSGEFTYFNKNGWEEIKPQLEAEKQRLKVTLPGRKHARNQRPYFTFIGKDGVTALKKYLNTKRGKIGEGEAIILNERGDPITRDALESYFTRHAQKIGVIKRWTPKCGKCGGATHYKRKYTPRPKRKSYIAYLCNKCGNEIKASDIEVPLDVRYKAHPHEMRDLFRSEWELSPAKPVVAEFLMGHDIDQNSYNKFYKTNPEWVKEQYAEAEQFLNILSNPEPRKVPINEVKELRKRLDKRNGEIKKLRDDIRELQKERSFKTEDLSDQEQHYKELIEEKVREEIQEQLQLIEAIEKVGGKELLEKVLRRMGKPKEEAKK